MKAKSAMATAIISMFCLAAGPVFAHQGAGSNCPSGGSHGGSHMTGFVSGSPYVPMVAPQFIVPYHDSSRRFASAFHVALAAPPVAILKSREGRANIVLSDVPVHACSAGSRAAFALNRYGDVVYGCEKATDGHFSVCWKGYGCHRYESSKWDMVALSKPLHR